jgi:hypothetical protein
VQAGIIPGFPGDTREAFLETVRRLAALQERFPGLLKLNVEPFVVSPGQPIYGELRRHGLEGVGWDEATLSIAPQLRDVAEGVLCRVEGDNQGMERLGQLRVVGAAANALPASAAVAFRPVGHGIQLLVADEVTRERFLLVTDEEAGALSREPGQGIEAIAREHLGGCEAWTAALDPDADAGAAIVLSPLVVARVMGSTLWLFDGATHALARLPASAASLVQRLRTPALPGELAGAEEALQALRGAGMVATAGVAKTVVPARA